MSQLEQLQQQFTEVSRELPKLIGKELADEFWCSIRQTIEKLLTGDQLDDHTKQKFRDWLVRGEQAANGLVNWQINHRILFGKIYQVGR